MREVREETGLVVARWKIQGVFHHSGVAIRSERSSCLPGICVCYRVEVVGELIPAELEDMHWAHRAELRALVINQQLTPWAEYFVRDLA